MKGFVDRRTLIRAIVTVGERSLDLRFTNEMKTLRYPSSLKGFSEACGAEDVIVAVERVLPNCC